MPVIAIGVPTVIDAQTFANDVLNSQSAPYGSEYAVPRDRQLIVIPREIDLLTERAARLLGFSLNAAMQNAFELKDLISLM